jgi:Protein of unknown function (DUF3551)
MRSMCLTIAALALLAGVEPSGAEITYPRCAQYGGDRGGRNCGFNSWDQCRAAVSGNGGFCIENPMYRPTIDRRRARRADG